MQISTKQLVEQQSIELIDSAKRRRLRWCGKLSSSSKQQQHSVQVRVVRKLRWHETSAETPNKCQLRDCTRTASEADGSVFQLQDAEVTCVITILTGVSSKNISQTWQQQQLNSTVVARAQQQHQSSGTGAGTAASCTPKAAPGTSVEEGEPGGARGGKAQYYIPGLREADCVSSSSSNSRATQQLHEAAAVYHITHARGRLRHSR